MKCREASSEPLSASRSEISRNEGAFGANCILQYWILNWQHCVFCEQSISTVQYLLPVSQTAHKQACCKTILTMHLLRKKGVTKFCLSARHQTKLNPGKKMWKWIQDQVRAPFSQNTTRTPQAQCYYWLLFNCPMLQIRTQQNLGGEYGILSHLGMQKAYLIVTARVFAPITCLGICWLYNAKPLQFKYRFVIKNEYPHQHILL